MARRTVSVGVYLFRGIGVQGVKKGCTINKSLLNSLLHFTLVTNELIYEYLDMDISFLVRIAVFSFFFSESLSKTNYSTNHINNYLHPDFTRYF